MTSVQMIRDLWNFGELTNYLSIRFGTSSGFVPTSLLSLFSPLYFKKSIAPSND